jgi:hypothetical protein
MFHPGISQRRRKRITVRRLDPLYRIPIASVSAIPGRPLLRSADLQSAVSPNCIRQGLEISSLAGLARGLRMANPG